MANLKHIRVQFDYPVEQVFAAAVRAYEINDGYVKVNEIAADQSVKSRNLDIVIDLLRDPDRVNENDYSKARDIITYYQSKLLDLMAGKLNSYSQSACEVSNKESISTLMEIGLIASLPKAYIQSSRFDEILEKRDRAYAESFCFGNPGDTYEGVAEVISSIYSTKWFRNFHSAVDTKTKCVINFSSNDKLEPGLKYKIRGRIKDHKDSKITRLNYVKLSVDESV